MAKRLLIGGPKDGEVYDVMDDRMMFLRVAVYDPPTLLKQVESRMPVSSFVRTETYSLAKFSCGSDKVVSMYVHESVPLDSVMERLIANYRPEKKK